MPSWSSSRPSAELSSLAPERRRRAAELGVLALLALAVLPRVLAYRLPALVHPWGWVNTDGAYGAFVALRLLAGVRPAPVFTIGANYQGTLTGPLAALFSLVSGAEDLSRMLVLASLVLDLLFIAARMSVGGRS